MACRLVPFVAVCTLAACSGPQSALDTASDEAARVADLFWIMASAAGVIWTLVVAFAVYAARTGGEHRQRRSVDRMIVFSGVVLPALALAALLSYGLSLLPDARARDTGLRIAVSGEQWWWRVAYFADGSSEPVASANEIRLPLGRSVEIELTSPDVIHSFWVPPLGGKLDMIPGRTTRLVLKPARTGVFRGVCAEYCGSAHALMAFPVIVMERRDFRAWLNARSGPNVAGAEGRDKAAAGLNAFLATGCGACHTVRGTPAKGTLGPDLTHVGSRRTIGAGILPNTPANMRRWLTRTDSIKPGVHMPSFGMLAESDLAALTDFLMASK